MQWWIESLTLGLVQGLTEFIPVSSSGHLVIAQFFFSGASDHLLLETINIGTLAALLVYFRRRIMSAIHDVFIRRQYRLARNILITAVPAGIVGFFAADLIAHSAFFGSIITVIITLSAIGILLIIIDKLPRAASVKDGDALSKRAALFIGIAQMIALIPGVSRSGATIIAGRLNGLSSASAAEYSFLASIPLMIGVVLKVVFFDTQYIVDNALVVVVSNAVAFISGLLAVGFLMRYLARHSLAIFGWYRLFVAAVLIVILLIQ